MSLTRDQWLRVEELFAQLLEMPQAERRTRLTPEGMDDTAVYEEVAAMLDAVESGGDFLARPIQVTSTEPVPESLPRGAALGPWRILEPLGRGGMGEVYRAERADGTYQQCVAIKLLKRGLDTDELLGRFLRERRILAQLEHPNIAHLIDAGAASDGRPYLVMEYVEGRPITEWCKARQVPLARVLELMCEVCEAVHAAHRRLVVHRDLKPSNVLVTDGGVVKLLDFGIAKLVGDPSGEETLTQLGSAPITPQYAAPEQVLGQPVTTATDVYSLGILLYQLLTGRLPYEHASVATAAVAFSKGAPTIVRPSTTRRNARPEPGAAAYLPHAKEIEGDLDWIVLKCLQNDPERRYRSASELADDLQRFLEKRPIVARPDTLAYRTGRFVRRNSVSVAVAAIVFVMLVAGIAGTVWQARNAQRQAARAGLIKDFVVSVFQQQDPLGVPGKNTLTPKQMIAASINRANEELQGDHDLHSELLADLGEIQYNLGDAEGALATLQSVLDEEQAHYGSSSLQAAEALRKLTLPLSILARHDEERKNAERALAILVQHGAGETIEGARVKLRLAIALSWGNGAPPASIALHEEVDRAFRAQLGPDHPETIRALLEHANTVEQGRHDPEAEMLLREVVTRYEARYGADTPRLGVPLSTLARVVARQDRPEEAIALCLRAIRLMRPSLGPRNHYLANALSSLGNMYSDLLGRFKEAEQALEEGQAALAEGDDGTRLELLRELGRLHLSMGRPDQAEPELREVFEQMRKIEGEQRGFTWYNGSEWGRALAAQGRIREAEAIQRQAAQKLDELMGKDAYQNCLIADALADTLEKKGNSLDEVLKLRRRSLHLTEQKYPNTNSLWAERATALARALMAQDTDTARAEAQPLLDQAAADYRAKSAPMDKAGATLLLRGQLEAETGQLGAAVADLREALERLQHQPVLDPAAVKKTQSLLHELDAAKGSDALRRPPT